MIKDCEVTQNYMTDEEVFHRCINLRISLPLCSGIHRNTLIGDHELLPPIPSFKFNIVNERNVLTID